MNNANIILGLGNGDEGKGITTDFVGSLEQPKRKLIGIRFSGGPNAGHNVVVGNKQHVFSNFSSATFRGAGTYYTEHTCFNLLNISIERNVLEGKMGDVPLVNLHPLSQVVTPYDVAYNQLLNSISNHGSTGKGISTTFKRNKETGHKLYAIDLTCLPLFMEKLEGIRKYYIELASVLGREVHFKEKYEQYERQWLNQVRNWKYLVVVSDYNWLEFFSSFIFESTQGALLDMDHGTFPNVTYSNTTSRNAMDVCNYLGVSPSIWYVTRCYQTRHGNGWMSNEGDVKLSLLEGQLDTNPTNPHQGPFRTGELNYELLNYALEVDAIYSFGCEERNLVVTCLDQRPDFSFHYGKLHTDFNRVYESYSPDCDTFKRIHKQQTS